MEANNYGRDDRYIHGTCSLITRASPRLTELTYTEAVVHAAGFDHVQWVDHVQW